MRSVLISCGLIFTVFCTGMSAFAGGATVSRVCSNSNASIKVAFYGIEGEPAKDDKYELKFLSMFGPEVKVFKGDEMDVKENQKVVLSEDQVASESVCGKKYYTVRQEYVVEMTIKKKDGTVMHQDDTPQTDVKQLKDYVICSSSVTDAWPCP